MLPETFCVFILTHGRPDNVITLETLRRCGYTGRLYLVLDNEDKTVERYKANFGAEKVIVFDKKTEADACDEGNNFDDRRTPLMARNACFKIAEQLGVTHFLVLDDDYKQFEFRHLSPCGLKLLTTTVKNLDALFVSMLEFFIRGGFTSLALAQGGDFIGGVGSWHVVNGFPLVRKCMNSFFCSTQRPFKFIGALNDDVNTYTTLGSRGLLFGTVSLASLIQQQTQAQAGGITEMYERFGTYCKSFTTVVMMPSAVSVSMIPGRERRLHHSIRWANTVPCIVQEKWRKNA